MCRDAALDEEIGAAIGRAVARLAAAGVPVDRGDLEQAGWLIALDAIQTFDAGRGPLAPYLSVVLRASLGKEVARWLHPCALSDHAARAAEAVERELVDDLQAGGESPEDLLAAAEARARVAQAIAEVLASMPARAAEIAGSDPLAPAPEVAARMGVSEQRVRHVRGDFHDRARASALLRELATG
jgi:hypothetical protein